MTTGKRIKIIKRAARHGPQAVSAEESSATMRKAGVLAQREAMTIINGWVRELRQKKVATAARGFGSLFHEAA